MKNLFYKVFLIGVLGLAFSVHSQEQESEWMTCLSEHNLAGLCIELQKHHIIKIEYEANKMWIYYNDSREKNYTGCLDEHYVSGQQCRRDGPTQE